jgi:predicted enzyme related to lactoylglutathione lyase
VRFYERSLGFTHTAMDMGPGGTYRVLEQGGAKRGGIMAGPGAPSWLPYVAVDDCDAAVKRATGNGGAVQLAPTDIPGIGRFAVIGDPLGARLAIMKSA